MRQQSLEKPLAQTSSAGIGRNDDVLQLPIRSDVPSYEKGRESGIWWIVRGLTRWPIGNQHDPFGAVRPERFQVLGFRPVSGGRAGALQMEDGGNVVNGGMTDLR